MNNSRSLVHRHVRRSLITCAFAGMGVLTACGGTATTASPTSSAPAASAQASGSPASSGGNTVSAMQTSIGAVLAGPSGKTLYVLLGSSGAPVACTGGCLAAWPPVMLQGTAQPAAGVTASLGSSRGQLMVGDDPVYYFSGDSAPGQANGEGLRSFGGTWYALHANGQPVAAGASAGTTPTPGYGY